MSVTMSSRNRVKGNVVVADEVVVARGSLLQLRAALQVSRSFVEA